MADVTAPTSSRSPGFARWTFQEWARIDFPTSFRTELRGGSIAGLTRGVMQALTTAGFNHVTPADYPLDRQPQSRDPYLEGIVVGERIDPSTSVRRLSSWVLSTDGIPPALFVLAAFGGFLYTLSQLSPLAVLAGLALVVMVLVGWFFYYNRLRRTIIIRFAFDPPTAVPPNDNPSHWAFSTTISYATLVSQSEGEAGFRFVRIIRRLEPISKEAAGIPGLLATLASSEAGPEE